MTDRRNAAGRRHFYTVVFKKFHIRPNRKFARTSFSKYIAMRLPPAAKIAHYIGLLPSMSIGFVILNRLYTTARD